MAKYFSSVANCAWLRIWFLQVLVTSLTRSSSLLLGWRALRWVRTVVKIKKWSFFLVNRFGWKFQRWFSSRTISKKISSISRFFFEYDENKRSFTLYLRDRSRPIKLYADITELNEKISPLSSRFRTLKQLWGRWVNTQVQQDKKWNATSSDFNFKNWFFEKNPEKSSKKKSIF